MSKEKGSDVWFGPVEGMRGLTHLSLIGLHAAMMTTAHLPSAGTLWDGFRKNPVYSVLQAGGTQVDICFLLSGFLLTYRLLSAPSEKQPTLVQFVVKRAMRMLPAMVFVIIVGLCMGDNWDPPYNDGVPTYKRILANLAFVGNCVDVSKWGAFTVSLMWSNSVDFQCSVVLVLLVGLMRQIRGDRDKEGLIKALRLVLFGLVITSIVICGALFEKDTLNIFKLGQSSHYGLLQTDNSYKWIADTYGHTWHTTNSAASLAHVFMNGMYLPTYTRFGPFAAGGFLATNVLLAQMSKQTDKNSSRSSFSIACLLFTVMAGVNLAIPCIPPEDEAPIEAQFIATAALRLLAAASAGTFLYRALVPASHDWSSSWIRAFFSLQIFAPIGRVSYASYLIHFRLLEYLNFNHRLLPLPETPSDPQAWVFYMLKLYAMGAVGSLVIATVFHHAVEAPVLKFTRTLMQAKTPSKKSE